MSPLSQEGVVALTWSFTGAGLVLTVGRYLIRRQTVGHLDWDDWVHGLAVVTLLGFVSTYTASFPRIFAAETWATLGKGPPSEEELSPFSRIVVAAAVQFWACIYLIKLSFLAFYRQLFGVSQSFMKAWWAVTAFTLTTFLINCFSAFWSCGTPTHIFLARFCLSQSALARTATIQKMWCVLSVISDLSIMALPLWMLIRLQMRTAQKLGLALVFMLALVDIIVDILRTIYSISEGVVSLHAMIFEILEATIAVIISCLPTYRIILGNLKPSIKPSSYKSLGSTSNVKMTYMTRVNCRSRDDFTVTSSIGNTASAAASRDAANEFQMV